VSPWSRDARFSAMKMRSLMNLLTGALRLTLTLTLTLTLPQDTLFDPSLILGESGAQGEVIAGPARRPSYSANHS
jgi:hypothetical protein